MWIAPPSSLSSLRSRSRPAGWSTTVRVSVWTGRGCLLCQRSPRIPPSTDPMSMASSEPRPTMVPIWAHSSPEVGMPMLRRFPSAVEPALGSIWSAWKLRMAARMAGTRMASTNTARPFSHPAGNVPAEQVGEQERDGNRDAGADPDLPPVQRPEVGVGTDRAGDGGDEGEQDREAAERGDRAGEDGQQRQLADPRLAGQPGSVLVGLTGDGVCHENSLRSVNPQSAEGSHHVRREGGSLPG